MPLLPIIPSPFFFMRTLAFAAVGLFISFVCTPQFAHANSAKPTKAVSSAELEFRDQIDNEALLGKYTVVSFYFSEWAPCMKEVPLLNAFAERNKEFSTLAVTFDSADEAKKFARRTRLSWRTIAGAEELIGQIGVKSYPTFALLDPKGVVVTIENGFEAAGKGATLDQWVKNAIASRTQ